MNGLVLDGLAAFARDRSAVLLSILTCSTLWRVWQSGGCSMKLLVVDCLSKDSHSEEELDNSEGDVPQPLMPSEELFLRFREIHVLAVNRIDVLGKVNGTLSNSRVPVTGGNWEIVEWGHFGFNRSFGWISSHSHKCH